MKTTFAQHFTLVLLLFVSLAVSLDAYINAYHTPRQALACILCGVIAVMTIISRPPSDPRE